MTSRRAIALAAVLSFLSICSFTYWLFFMSWSHSWLAPSFQHRQALVLGVGTASLVSAALAGVWAAFLRLSPAGATKGRSSTTGR